MFHSLLLLQMYKVLLPLTTLEYSHENSHGQKPSMAKVLKGEILDKSLFSRSSWFKKGIHCRLLDVNFALVLLVIDSVPAVTRVTGRYFYELTLTK